NQFQGSGIDAIAQAGRFRPIRKNMSVMCIAYIAQYLNPIHAHAFVHFVANDLFLHRLAKAGPTRSGSKLIGRIEEFRSTTNAGINTRLKRLATFPCSVLFVAVFAVNHKLFLRKFFAPFIFSLLYALRRFWMLIRYILISLFPIKHNKTGSLSSSTC